MGVANLHHYVLLIGQLMDCGTNITSRLVRLTRLQKFSANKLIVINKLFPWNILFWLAPGHKKIPESGIFL